MQRAAGPDTDTSIRLACFQFASAARAALAIESLAVALLDSEGDTSRIVHSWKDRRRSPSPAFSPNPTEGESEGVGPAMNLPLHGRKSLLGAVLLRSKATDGLSRKECKTARELCDRLAMQLEIALLDLRLGEQSVECSSLDQLAAIASSGAPIHQVCRQFAAEVKKLVPYQSFAVCVLHPDRDEARCVYRKGPRLRSYHRQADCFLATQEAPASASLEDGPSSRQPDYQVPGCGIPVTIPIKFAGRAVGAVHLQDQRASGYTSEEMAFLQRAVTLLGPPVATSMRLQEPGRRHRELAGIQRLSNLGRSLESSPESLQKFVEELQQLVEVDNLTLKVFDRQRLHVKRFHAGHGTPEYSEVLLSSPGAASDSDRRWLQRRVASDRGRIRHDLRRGKQTPRTRELVQQGFRSSLDVPMHAADGPVGVLTIYSRKPSAYNTADKSLMEDLAHSVAQELQRSRLYQELEEVAGELSLVDQIARILTGTSDLRRVYERFTLELKKLVCFDWMAINRLDDENGFYHIYYHNGTGLPDRHFTEVRPLKGSQTKYVTETGSTLVLDDITRPPWFPTNESHLAAGLRSSIMVPLLSQGRVIGVLSLRSRQVAAYGPRERAIVERVASQIGPTVENTQLHQRIHDTELEKQVSDEVASILTSTPRLEQAFDSFAAAVNRLVPLCRAGLCWLDPNGNDIHTLSTTPDDAAPETAESAAGAFCLHTRLVHFHRVIGILSLERWQEPFSFQEQETLDRLGSQLTPAVQSVRLDQQTQRQAYHLQRLIASGAHQGRTDQGMDPSDATFLDDLAHSVRSPLTSIMGYSSTLLQPDLSWPPELLQKFLKTINDETVRLHRAVDGLLFPPPPAPQSQAPEGGSETARQVLARIEGELSGETWLRPFRVECPPSLPDTAMSPENLAQVVRHLARCSDSRLPPGRGLLARAWLQKGQCGIWLGPEDAGETCSPEDWGISVAGLREEASLSAEDQLRLDICCTTLETYKVTLYQQGKGENTAFWFELPAEPNTGA